MKIWTYAEKEYNDKKMKRYLQTGDNNAEKIQNNSGILYHLS